MLNRALAQTRRRILCETRPEYHIKVFALRVVGKDARVQLGRTLFDRFSAFLRSMKRRVGRRYYSPRTPLRSERLPVLGIRRASNRFWSRWIRHSLFR